ncbi:MAG: H-lectin domain-containing protein [Thermoanaerobacterium thermosaccharolyticum]
MYDITNWQDEVKDQNGSIIQQGTPLSARNMNNIEAGLYEANVLASMLAQQSLQQKRILSDIEGEIREITLTNSETFPFNNSIQTIALQKQRDTLNYRVITEVVSADGEIGDVIVTDKQLNGFKIAFTGSAKNVTIKYYVQGGMYQ